MTDTNAMRGQIAKIIDPEAFAENWVLSEATYHLNQVGSYKKADAILALLATDRATGVGERHSLGEGFGCQYDDDDYTITWPDGRWLVAHRCGKITTGKSPYDPAIPPRQTDIAAMLAPSRPAPADASDFSPHRWTEIVSNGLGANNAGCWRCGALSEVLARVLSLSGHDAKVIQGKANGEDHVWVQIGDTVYDPTVGQFQEPVSYQMDQVAPADASGEVERRWKAALKDIADAEEIPTPVKAFAWCREVARTALNPTAGAK